MLVVPETLLFRYSSSMFRSFQWTPCCCVLLLIYEGENVRSGIPLSRVGRCFQGPRFLLKTLSQVLHSRSDKCGFLATWEMAGREESPKEWVSSMIDSVSRAAFPGEASWPEAPLPHRSADRGSPWLVVFCFLRGSVHTLLGLGPVLSTGIRGLWETLKCCSAPGSSIPS